MTLSTTTFPPASACDENPPVATLPADLPTLSEGLRQEAAGGVISPWLDLRLMDCMDLMREFPDKYFDLAIVDPPYGIGMDGGKKYMRKGKGYKVARQREYKPFGDNQSPDAEYFNEVFRVSKNQIVWGANHFIEKMPRNSTCWIIWDKLTGEWTSADCELAWASFKTAVKKFEFKWAGFMQGDMNNKEDRIHPTQKPVALYKWLLAKYAKPGQRILDTHLGSGSHAIACHYFGAHLTACEIDPDYFTASTERINRETAQTDIFQPATPQPKHEQPELV